MRVLATEFRGFLLALTFAFGISVALFYFYYPQDQLPNGKHMTFLQAAYYTLLMIFFESPLQYVEDWRLSPLFFMLPIVGLVTIAEGVVHLGNLLFQHKRYSKEWQKMIAETMENHVVVCGLGNVGVRVVQHLRRFSEEVVAIESNPDARFVGEVAGYEVPVLFGDVRDTKVLESASIAKAKAIIAVTDNDLANLEAAMTAREINPTIRVVIRMFDQKLAKKVEKFMGIEGAYSSSARSARLFAQAAISGNIIDSFEFGGTVINAVQLTVEENTIIVGQTVDHLRNNYEVTVLCHEPTVGVADWNPAPTTPLVVGDKLLIMTDSDGLKRLTPLSHKITEVHQQSN
jgi:Trk K+ transport system NAD-binding subunit